MSAIQSLITVPLLPLLLAAFTANAAAAGAGNAAPAVPAPAALGDPRSAVPPGRDDAGDRLSRIEQAMWDRNPEAAPLLREWATRDPNDRVRERSVGALALIRDPQAVPIFLGRLDGDPSPAVRRAAAEALGVLRNRVDARRLADPLRKDPDPFVRAECARAIGRIGNSVSGPPLLISVVEDPSPEVRALAAEALAALRFRDAADILRAAVELDDSVLVRIYAVRALAGISPASAGSQFRTVWNESSDPDLRLEAFRGLLFAGNGDVWEAAGLADGDERIRFLAFQEWISRTLEARAGIDGPPDRAVEARLEGFLTDRVRGIRELAKEQLESLGFRIRRSGFGYSVER